VDHALLGVDVVKNFCHPKLSQNTAVIISKI
jgi:hypothetical protein